MLHWIEMYGPFECSYQYTNTLYVFFLNSTRALSIFFRTPEYFMYLSFMVCTFWLNMKKQNKPPTIHMIEHFSGNYSSNKFI